MLEYSLNRSEIEVSELEDQYDLEKNSVFHVDSVYDEMKLKFFQELWKKYSWEEIEKITKK